MGGGGGGAVSFRPDTKSGGGGGGGGGGFAVRFMPDTKSGEGLGGGCLAEEGKVPYNEGGVATCNPLIPPPPPPPNPPLPGRDIPDRSTLQVIPVRKVSELKKKNSQLYRLYVSRVCLMLQGGPRILQYYRRGG